MNPIYQKRSSKPYSPTLSQYGNQSLNKFHYLKPQQIPSPFFRENPNRNDIYPSHKVQPPSKQFHQNRLSNAIYLKSSENQYSQQNDALIFKGQLPKEVTSKIEQVQSEYFQPLSHQKFAYKANMQSTHESTFCQKDDDFSNNQTYDRYIQSMIQKFGYSPELRQSKELKQTRQNTYRYNESAKKREQSPSEMEFYGIFKPVSQLNKRFQTKSYLKQSVTPFRATYSPRNHYSDSREHKIQTIRQVSPEKTQILVEEYHEQNCLLEKQNEQLQKNIENQIEKERLLLHKLNLLMAKLQTLKQSSGQTSQEKLNQSSKSTQQLSLYLPQSSRKKLTHQTSENQQYFSPYGINSIQCKFPKIKQKTQELRLKDRAKREEEKQNLSSLSKHKLNLQTSEINFPGKILKNITRSPIIKTLPDTIRENCMFKERNRKIESSQKSQYQDADLDVSCFDSKFVPRMSNKEKLIELEKSLQDELKKYFASQISHETVKKMEKSSDNKLERGRQMTKNDNRDRNSINRQTSRQKLNLLSQQIKQMRQIVAEEEQNPFSNK